MKTITKLATAALLAMSAVAPALAFEPESQILVERGMSAVHQGQAYVAHAQAVAAPAFTVAPEAQLLTERSSYMASARQDDAYNAHAEVAPEARVVTRTWAGTRR